MNASEAERLNTMGTPNGDNTQAAADSIKVVSSTPSAGPIGVFDSGYGGLTILHEMRSLLPQYDYLYLGDNARAPYGPRSFDVVYQFTREAVIKLFSMGCRLVILACNTASAKAILATEGTIKSESYVMEINKLYPDIKVTGVACPLWVPLIENNEYDTPGADYFVKKRIDSLLFLDPEIDSVILGCTHYPILLDKILKYTPRGVKIIPQGEYVANSLKTYLARHPEMDAVCAKHGRCHYLTTENKDKFRESARIFMHESVDAETISF